MKRKGKRKTSPTQDPLLAEQLCQIRNSGLRVALEGLGSAMRTGTMDIYRRKRLVAYLRSFRLPSVHESRAEEVKAFIRERFARTGKPVSATVIAKYLKEDKEIMVLGNERFVAPGYNVTRTIVIKYLYPLLHQDKGLTCTGRGPAGGWKPVA